MLVRIRHKGLQRYFETGDMRGIQAKHASWIRIILSTLDAARKPEEINFPAMRLHALKGDLAGFWSVSISAKWRIIFRFDGDNVTDVDLLDYH